MRKLLSALLLTSFLFGQDILITVSGSTYEGEYTERTENGVMFQVDGALNPQEIALSKVDRLILSDGTLLIDYGEFTDGTKKVNVSKDWRDENGSGSGFGVRKIGGLLIGISGVILMSIVNRDIDKGAPEEERNDFTEKNKSDGSLAYTLLAVGGLLIALDKE
jgi:hypothetical protein